MWSDILTDLQCESYTCQAGFMLKEKCFLKAVLHCLDMRIWEYVIIVGFQHKHKQLFLLNQLFMHYEIKSEKVFGLSLIIV